MARPAGGEEDLIWARELLVKAKTADEIRHAQAVLLPLELGLSLEQTAKAIGRSVSLTCMLRNRARHERLGTIKPKRSKTDLRNRATLTLEGEAAILEELLADARNRGLTTVPMILPAFEKALGKTVALSSLYRILARHGWRKHAPDTQHSPDEPALRGKRKKNSLSNWRKD